jgi:hypothetical protein
MLYQERSKTNMRPFDQIEKMLQLQARIIAQ